MSNVKKRYWACVFYPESMPNNWKDILIETGLPIAISPLHDKDINPDNTLKKPHYHVILCYDGPTTFNAVNNICQRLGQPIPIPLESVRGYFRYFTHKDNPEKYQYSDLLITCLNGFNYRNFIELSSSEVLSNLKLINNLIKDNNILEYFDLINFLQENESLHECFDVAVNHTFYVNSYITSFRQKTLKSQK